MREGALGNNLSMGNQSTRSAYILSLISGNKTRALKSTDENGMKGALSTYIES